MKTQSIFIAALAVVFSFSCAKESLSEKTPDTAPSADSTKLVALTISASSGEESDSDDTQSRTTLGGATGKSVLWTSTDKVKVFDRVSSSLPAFTIISGEGTSSASFSGAVSQTATPPYYAMVPYQESATCIEESLTISNVTASSYLTVRLPEVQKAVAGSVDPEALISVAQSNDGLKYEFRNLISLVKFRLNADDVSNLETVSFSGNELESVAGSMKVIFSEAGVPVQTYVSGEMSFFVTLTKPDGGWQSGVDYYFAVRGLTFKSGITINARYSDGTSKYFESSKAMPSLSRNSILNIKELKLKDGISTDLYIAYLHGVDIPVGDKIINKTSNPTSRLMKSNGNVGEGLVFVNPDLKSAVFSTNHSNLIAIGRYSNRPSVIKREGYVRIAATDGQDLFALKNIKPDITLGSAELYPFALSKDDITFEEVIFDSCPLILPKAELLRVNKRDADKFVFTDCDIKFNQDKSYLVMYSSENVTSLESFIYRNNILYSETDVKSCYLLSCSGVPVNNLVVEDNTLINVYCGSNGFVYMKSLKNLSFNRNIFYFPNLGQHSYNSSGAHMYYFLARCYDAKLDSYPSEGKAFCDNNFVYRIVNSVNQPDDADPIRAFKSTHLDLKNGSTYYTGVKNPLQSDVSPFSALDLSVPSYTVTDACLIYGGAKR